MTTATDPQTRIQALEVKLKNFDWYYVYSDDYSVVRSGDEYRNQLVVESNQLRHLGYAEQVDALWSQYRK